MKYCEILVEMPLGPVGKIIQLTDKEIACINRIGERVKSLDLSDPIKKARIEALIPKLNGCCYGSGSRMLS